MSDAVEPEIETLTLGHDQGRETITCLRCQRISYNSNDVENRYCGHCHVFHEDILPAERAAWLESF